MKKFLPLLMVVLLVVALSVPAFASEVNSNFYNFGGNIGYVSTMIKFTEYDTESMFVLTVKHIILDYVEDENKLVLVATSGDVVATSLIIKTVGEQMIVRAEYDYDNQIWICTEENWVEDGTTVRGSHAVEWTYTDIYDIRGALYKASNYGVCDGSTCPSTDVNKDNVCDDCGREFAVLRDYSPFTVTKFMNHIGQLFTSAVSWVSYVGAAILAQPLLLAFTALPLCGLGIAVFRRMKETV